ncbi:MAG: VOC family protein [Candidatus Binatia bacterium]|nr:VOC family protein [Candidatus Binatia bacterium]
MLRIRQLALVARDLEPVVEDLCAVLGVSVCFRDPGVATFGLVNALMPIGNQFLEVVSPATDGTSAGRQLERNGGDGGYMVILQTDDLATARSRVLAGGARVVWEVELEDIATIHLHPRDVGGAIVSLDQCQEPDEWRWAGGTWREAVSTDVVSEIRAAEVYTEAPDPVGRRWTELFGRELVPQGDGFDWPLDGNAVRFVRGTGREGFHGMELTAPGRDKALEVARERGLPVDGDRVTIAGTSIRLKAP